MVISFKKVENKDIIDFLGINFIFYKENSSLKKISYFETGGNLNLSIYPSSVGDFSKVIEFLNYSSIPYRVFGATSNSLFLNECEYDVFIFTKDLNSIKIDRKTNEVVVGAGVMMPAFAKKCAQVSLTGFEGLCGIPGTIGGGIYMNAGAFGNEISHHLIDVTTVNAQGEIIKYTKGELEFGFRHSVFQDRKLGYIVEARFQGTQGDKSLIQKKIEECSYSRKNYQEQKHPNLGSLCATFSLYEDFARCHPRYKQILNIDEKYRYWFRQNNNNFLNFLTIIYFRLFFKNQPFSNKTLNCLINTGQNYKDIMKYIDRIKEITKGTVTIENEIVEGRRIL